VSDLVGLCALAALAALLGAWQVITRATHLWSLAAGIVLALVGAAYAVLAVAALLTKENPHDEPE
jgi:heme A synthase